MGSIKKFSGLILAALALAVSTAQAVTVETFTAVAKTGVLIGKGLGEAAHSLLFKHMQRSGLLLNWANGANIPGKEDFRQYQVTSDRESEVIRQTLYDSLLYPLAGQTEFVFFSEGQGSGVTSTPGNTVGSKKILSDTNAAVNGMLPNGMAYMCESLECFFWPGASATALTFTPSKYTTDATGVLIANSISAINDKKLVYETGQLIFTVLQKPQLQETPLGVFPPKTWMEVDSALATTAATTTLAIANARPMGRAYYLDPPIAIAPTVSFNVKVSYPALQALPSGFNGRMMFKFDGYLNRAAQ